MEAAEQLAASGFDPSADAEIAGEEETHMMSDKGDPAIQRERVKKAVEGAYDFMARAEFDTDRPGHWLRFRIDAVHGPMLSNDAVEYHVSEIADKTDEELKQLVAHLAPAFSKVWSW